MKKLFQDDPRGSPGDAAVTGRRRRGARVGICSVHLSFPSVPGGRTDGMNPSFLGQYLSLFFPWASFQDHVLYTDLIYFKEAVDAEATTALRYSHCPC